MNQCLTQLRNCDVILKNGAEEFIGLYFDPDKCDMPIVLLKNNCNFDYFLTKLAERSGIPCLEQKLLVRLMYSKSKERKPITEEYIGPIARIYSKLNKFQFNDDENSFIRKLNEDINDQMYELEKSISREVLRELKTKEFCTCDFSGNILEYFQTELKDLVEKYEINYKALYNPVYKVYEYCFSFSIKEYDKDFWQIVFISEVEEKIFIGTASLVRVFDFNESEKALATIKALVIAYNTKLKKDASLFNEEFNFSPKQCDIAKNSIITLLEMNYKENRYDFRYDFDNLCYITIYLKKIKPEDQSLSDLDLLLSARKPVDGENRMYELLITYKEFMRNPDIFREFIKQPKQFKKWNFWCKERKYDDKYFSSIH